MKYFFNISVYSNNISSAIDFENYLRHAKYEFKKLHSGAVSQNDAGQTGTKRSADFNRKFIT